MNSHKLATHVCIDNIIYTPYPMIIDYSIDNILYYDVRQEFYIYIIASLPVVDESVIPSEVGTSRALFRC